jgi:hypothetical protein
VRLGAVAAAACPFTHTEEVMTTIHWLVRRPIPSLGLAAGDLLAVHGGIVRRRGSRRKLSITPAQLASLRAVTPVSSRRARMVVGRCAG